MKDSLCLISIKKNLGFWIVSLLVCSAGADCPPRKAGQSAHQGGRLRRGEWSDFGCKFLSSHLGNVQHLQSKEDGVIMKLALCVPCRQNPSLLFCFCWQELSHSQIKQEVVRLHEMLSVMETKRDAMEEEQKSMCSPKEEREKLFQQV